jgi:hypothetical protein
MSLKLVRDWKLTQRDLHQALRDFPERKLPPPVTDLTASIAILTDNWKILEYQHDNPIKRIFGLSSAVRAAD